MKYHVIKSVSGTVWYIYQDEKKRAAVSLGSMFKTSAEGIAFAEKLSALLNAEIEEPAKVEW